MHLQHEDIILDNNLQVAVDLDKNHHIPVEKLLEEEHIQYKKIFQSKYNKFCSYSELYSDTGGYIVNYYIVAPSYVLQSLYDKFVEMFKSWEEPEYSSIVEKDDKNMKRDETGLVSYSHITRDELVCGGTIINGMDYRIEEILNRCDAKIVDVFWQSRVNYYIKYDYEPFTTDLFLRQFIVHGSPEFLSWVNDKINNYLQCVNFAERCFAEKSVLSTENNSIEKD